MATNSKTAGKKDAQSAPKTESAGPTREEKRAEKEAASKAARDVAIKAGDIIVRGDKEFTVADPNSVTLTDKRAAEYLALIKKADKTPVLLGDLVEKLGCYPDAVQFWTALAEQAGLVKRFALTSSDARGKKPAAVLYIGE